MFQIIFEYFIDLLFPRFCCGCGKINTLLCPNCYSQIDFFSQEIKLLGGDNYLERLFSLAHYSGITKKLIAAVKYEGVIEVGSLLGKLLYHCFSIPKCDFITAVPIHYIRMRERGFNQAEIIAKEVSKDSTIPFISILERKVFSVPQASIHDREKRLIHLKNHFSITTELLEQFPIKGKTILLIDDVCTTGSTLQECAKVLREHGAHEVIGLTIAHGS